MRFDDREYLYNFYESGLYPKIHNDIFSMSEYVKADNVIDLGCCFGLLSQRLSTVYKLVVGVEPSEKYLNEAIANKKIKYRCMQINEKTLSDFKALIKEFNIEAVFARRVIPEIWETGGFELCYSFSKVLYDSGIKYIVLEGRKPTKYAVNPLYSIEKEGIIFDRWYKLVKQYKNCQVLERKEAIR